MIRLDRPKNLIIFWEQRREFMKSTATFFGQGNEAKRRAGSGATQNERNSRANEDTTNFDKGSTYNCCSACSGSSAVPPRLLPTLHRYKVLWAEKSEEQIEALRAT